MKTPEDAPILLIVDDMPLNVKILADALRHDYRIKVASQGSDALERARIEPRPDLILLDIMMPGMDGYEVCRRLKNDPLTESIPVIFVTAKDTEVDQDLGFRLGGVDYITKPFSLRIVQARVRSHIQLKRQAEALERLSYIDPLTGVPNRRQLQEVLEREWRRAARDGRPLAVLMIDIDHFKAYNDHYGHGAGDDCLRQVAEALRNALHRPGDRLARYGGEEFAAILPETDRATAALLAERLREAVLELRLPHEFSSAGGLISVSIGGAAAADVRAVASPAALLAQADRLLYRAKKQRRNLSLVEEAAPEPPGSGDVRNESD